MCRLVFILNTLIAKQSIKSSSFYCSSTLKSKTTLHSTQITQ
ncbi:hypothetical protein PPHE_b0805 [Pseudoalteromonas phenolica O-BC30]|nr:hypothetical protein [Pseudoalteromonas phenolica O-BC30]